MSLRTIWPMVSVALWASAVWGAAPDAAVAVRPALEAGRSTTRMGADRSANPMESQTSTVSKISHDGIILDGSFEGGSPSAESNFLVDDVSIQVATSIAELPVLSTAGLVGLSVLISGAVLIAFRRRQSSAQRA